jgi:glutamate synthase domain-containing protein 3
MKQTAVEWLFDQYVNKSIITIEDIEQAKEMEKQQIVEAHGNKLKKSKDEGNYEYWFSGEDYYNKTYK